MTEFDRICNEAELGDLRKKNRTIDVVTKRHAIWYKMYADSPNYSEISRQSGRDRCTIMSGIKRFDNLLGANDKRAVETWEKVKMV